MTLDRQLRRAILHSQVTSAVELEMTYTRSKLHNSAFKVPCVRIAIPGLAGDF